MLRGATNVPHSACCLAVLWPHFYFFKYFDLMLPVVTGKKTFVRQTPTLSFKVTVLPEVMPGLYRASEATLCVSARLLSILKGELQVKLPQGKAFHAVAEKEHARLMLASVLSQGCHNVPSAGWRKEH